MRSFKNDVGLTYNDATDASETCSFQISTFPNYTLSHTQHTVTRSMPPPNLLLPGGSTIVGGTNIVKETKTRRLNIQHRKEAEAKDKSTRTRDASTATNEEDQRAFGWMTRASQWLRERWTSWKPLPASEDIGNVSKEERVDEASADETNADLPCEPPISSIRSVVVLGVHGWFPSTRIMQTVFGEWLGTSERLCSQMANAVREELARQNIALDNVRITTIPLSSHGKVLDRVETLLALIKETPAHVDALQRADTIFMATHSQGMPVSVILLSRLLRSLLVGTSRQRIGLLCMAGIGHGPFPAFRGNLVVQYVEAEAARELFEFCTVADSLNVVGDARAVDKKMAARTSSYTHGSAIPPAVAEFYSSLHHLLLANNVKITLVASWLDPVVPLFSALLTAIEHPNILRAVHVDGHNLTLTPNASDNETDFPLRFTSFLLRLRNVGISDRGMLQLLSETVAGSLYSGIEHSTIYAEPSVYQLAFQWTLDLDSDLASISTTPLILPYFRPSAKLNQYHIPWAMAKLIASPDIQRDTELCAELDALIRAFDKWSPTVKAHRDLRHRLEPIKSRL